MILIINILTIIRLDRRIEFQGRNNEFELELDRK